MTPGIVQARLPNGPEKDHLQQLGRNHRAVGDSLRKCRVANIATTAHPPSNSPLSSPKGDGLRINFSSHPMRASVKTQNGFQAILFPREPSGGSWLRKLALEASWS